MKFAIYDTPNKPKDNSLTKIELQVHPFFKNYNLKDLHEVMERKNIDVCVLLEYNINISTLILNETKKIKNKDYNIEYDGLLFKLNKEDNSKYIIPAIEATTSDNFHFIVIGNNKTPANKYSKDLIENCLKNNALIIFAHPFVDCINPILDISKDKEKTIINLCKEYSNNLALEWNAYSIPWLRKLLGGNDVNKKVENLSEKLKSENYNNPVVATTDLHARNKRLLEALGTSYIESNVDLSSGTKFVSSLKNNIFSNNYRNHKEYVSFIHFIETFGLGRASKKFYNEQ